MKAKYYEAHITIEPVFDDKLLTLTNLLKPYRFKVADLLLQKRKTDTLERNQFDSFATGHDKSYNKLLNRMNEAVAQLNVNNYKVWRVKIEAVVLDEKYDRLSS